MADNANLIVCHSHSVESAEGAAATAKADKKSRKKKQKTVESKAARQGKRQSESPAEGVGGQFAPSPADTVISRPRNRSSDALPTVYEEPTVTRKRADSMAVGVQPYRFARAVCVCLRTRVGVPVL